MQIIRARVGRTSLLADGIYSIALVAADNAKLPDYTPGAHIDLHLPSGKIRQYSLYGDFGDNQQYEVAVQEEPAGKGGSKEAIEVLRPGVELNISAPRNNFPLDGGAQRSIFIAGGIGITPIVPMARLLERESRSFHLYYCTRTAEKTAFLQYAQSLAVCGLATIHHDAGQREAQLDFKRLLQNRPEGAHLYCCGPEGLMRAVREASHHWPSETVHWEYFTNAGLANATDDEQKPFRVQLARSGRVFDVPQDRSILDVLRSNAVAVESSCESGLCGTCKTRYVSGTPDHRDLVLSETEQLEYMMICCSRSRSDLLVLDA